MARCVVMGVGILGTSLAAVSPGRAEGAAAKPPPQQSRIIVQVEEWLATPRNLDLDYAFLDRSGSLSGGGEVFTLSGGSRAEPMFRVAWRSGIEGAPAVGASFWEFEDSAASATGRHDAMVGALLASPDFAIGRSLVDFAQASWRVRGTLVDADLAWEHDLGEHATLGLSAGLRLFRFEQETTIAYGSESSGSMLEEVLNVSTDASGAGPRTSLSLGYRLGRRVVVRGELGVALPVGDLEGEASDKAFVDGSFDRATASVRPGIRRAFTQLDGALRVQVAIAGRLAASVSYRYSHWPRVTLTERFVDDVSQNTAFPIEGDVVFEGASVAVRYEF